MGERASSTRRSSRRAVTATLAALALASPGAAGAFDKTFAANSLIIPTQMEYQTDCGMVSAYGLVYTILYKNAALVAAGKKPVTIYWVIQPRKQSHHRCDTGTDTLPDYSKYDDDDGCDFAVQSATGQPVALLDTTNNEVAPFNVYTTTYDPTTGQVTRSGAQSQAIDATKKVVKYSGGLWVIDATDRATVLGLLADPLLTKYRDNGTCTSLPVGVGASHNTMIHSARIGFTAPVARMMNTKPPLIALLAGQYVGILQGYLQNAGLDDIPGAGGNVTTHGVIYDVLTPLTDFMYTPANPLGALNMRDPNNPATNLYQVMWAPHWEENNDTVAGPVDGDPGDDVVGDGQWTHGGDPYKMNAFKNIAAFADDGYGVFLECASIASFEGSYKMGQAPCSSTYQCTCLDTSATPACAPLGSIAAQTCPAGAISMCNGCYQACPTGYTAKTSPCDQLRCVQDATPCPSGSTWRSSDMSCWSCNTSNGWTLVSPMATAPSTPQCRKNSNYQNATSVTPNGVAPTPVAGTCPSAYTSTCQPATASIELPGWDPVRFKITNRILKNGLSGGSWGGSYTVPDCTDQNVVGTKYKHAAISGDCFDFHPTQGGPGNMFSQKGSFNFTGATGHTSHWEPAAAVGSIYRPAVLQFATSRNATNATRAGWDFVTARHKDNDPTKGMVVYLGGHTYNDDPGGNRIVLNTMLNLGFSDSGTELARSEPVGYVTWGKDAFGKPTVTAQTVFQGTYVQRMPPGPFQDWINYNPAAPASWRFPYIDGHLRAYDLAKISTTGQDFASNALWDTATLVPAPDQRNLFTALGGNANLGWKKVPLDYTQTAPATCATPSGQVDANGNPVCDLSMKLAKCATAGVTQQQLLAGTNAASIASTLGLFVQQVRGYCASHDKTTGVAIMTPTAAQCDNFTSKWQRNQPFLGGVDHSSPAVVGPSPYIGGAVGTGSTASWSDRPVVAYFGARDGMLHAVYVSGDTSWTAGGATLPAGVKAGAELWAFVPPGQLCGLATNTAMVDANVNVLDVFGNFPRDANGDGVFDLTSPSERPNGIREWRTILVATSGEGGGEMFAMDVTNPLKPVVLWQVNGPDNSDDRFDMNGNGTFADTGDHLDRSKPQSYALKWFNSDDGTQGSHPWIPTAYDTTSGTVIDGLKAGRYDYHNLGYANGTAIGTLWSGNAFQFVAFVATSAADFVANPNTPLGYRGVEVFAVDVVNGQKLWQWENRYTRANAAGTVIADNGIPGRPALVDVDADGSVDRVYVGDFEGHLWELSAVDGRNLNYLPSSVGGKKSFPLWGTPAMTQTGVDAATIAAFKPAGGSDLAQQPLTSPIGVGRFTVVPTALKPYLENRIAIAQGTMGVDWSIAPTQPGHIYVAPAFPETGTRLTGTISSSAKSVDPLLSGVLLDAAIWDTPLDVGERVYGMPKIVSNQMFANTSYGSFSGDITTSLNDKGRTLRVTATGSTTLDTGTKRFGGVLVFGADVVSSSDTGLGRKASAAPTPTLGTSVRNRFTPAVPRSWELRPENDPSFVQ